MPGTQDQDTVKPLSYTPTGKDDGTKPGIPPIPALRTSTPKQASLEGAENFTSDTLSPTASLGLGGSSDNEPEEPIYATIDPDTKSSKKSLDSGIDGQNSILSRSPSQETVVSWKCDIKEARRKITYKNVVITGLSDRETVVLHIRRYQGTQAYPSRRLNSCLGHIYAPVYNLKF